jgi:gluconokinase
MVVVVMGVTGSGKSTVGRLIAYRLNWLFLDADTFHSPANIQKMEQGIALTDADRWPWLDAIHSKLLDCAETNQNVVLACSALKQTYRDRLSAGLGIRILYLKGSYAEVKSHLDHRIGHFASEAILAGQFADLEEPSDAVVFPVTWTPEEIVREALRELDLK